MRKGLVGFGGREGGGGFAGADEIDDGGGGCDLAPAFVENGLLSEDGALEHFA